MAYTYEGPGDPSELAMATALEIEKTVCPRCVAVLDASDRFCRYCGAALSPDGSPVPAAAADWPPLGTPAPPRPRWTDNPWIVLPLVLLVLGPIGLPLLWRSRGFTRFWKTVITVLVLALSAAVGVRIWYSIRASLAPLEQLRQIRGFHP